MGAALNIAQVNEGAENTVTLAIAAPEAAHTLEQQYQNVLAFSMALENAADRLTVPVQITLPVPNAANAAALVLFHYHDDGTREEVPYTRSTVDGQSYVTFVVTAFSDFQFAEGSGFMPGDVDQNGVVDIIDLQRLYAHLSGSNPLGSGLSRGDVDGNGTVDIIDLQRRYAHLNGSNPLS